MKTDLDNTTCIINQMFLELNADCIAPREYFGVYNVIPKRKIAVIAYYTTRFTIDNRTREAPPRLRTILPAHKTDRKRRSDNEGPKY